MGPFIRRAGVYVWHAIVCIAVLGLLLMVFWAASYAISVHHRRQAELLLQQLALLHPGASDFSAVQQISKEFGGAPHCASDVCSYDFEQEFAFSDSGPRRVFRRTEWDYFGLRPWQLTAHIKTKNRELTDTSFRVLVGRGRGWLYNEGMLSGSMWALLMVSVRINAEAFERNVRFEKKRAGIQQIEARNGIILGKPTLDTPGSGEMLTANLSPDAPPESKRMAFDVNLRCTTSMSPCTELCQLFPAAWQSYSQFQSPRGGMSKNRKSVRRRTLGRTGHAQTSVGVTALSDDKSPLCKMTNVKTC